MMYVDPDPGAVAEGVDERESTLPLASLLRVLWRRIFIIALVAALLTAVAVGVSLLQAPIYEASTKVIVGQEGSGSSNLGSDVQGLQQLTETVVEAVDSRVVAEAVIEELGLQTTPTTFLENLGVEQISQTQFIQVAYKDADAARSAEVANAVARVSSERISEVSPNANAITASVWEPAVAPDAPESPDPIRNAALALILGTMLGVGLAFLLELLDDSWRSPEEVEQISGVPTFGVVPRFEVTKPKARRSTKKGGR